jgi:prevent-host-death family protein
MLHWKMRWVDMQITNISEAKASLSRLIEKALRGEEVIIGKAGKPIVKIIPYDYDTSPRQLGVGNWRGQIWIADDFDELPEDVVRQFTGEMDEDEALA